MINITGNVARTLLGEESRVNPHGSTVGMCQVLTVAAEVLVPSSENTGAGIVSSAARSSTASREASEVCLDLQAEDCQQLLDTQTEG